MERASLSPLDDLRYSVRRVGSAPDQFMVTVELPALRLWLCNLEVYAASEDDLEAQVWRFTTRMLAAFHPRGHVLN